MTAFHEYRSKAQSGAKRDSRVACLEFEKFVLRQERLNCLTPAAEISLWVQRASARLHLSFFLYLHWDVEISWKGFYYSYMGYFLM